MKDKSDFLGEWLDINKIPYKKNYEIKYYSWIKAGGIIKNYITPETIDQCVNIIKFFKTNNMKFYIFGNQSNLIVRDGDIITPIINLSKMNKISFEEDENGVTIICDSGVSIPRFSKNIIKKGFTGTEGLVGIPGSIGGGVCMNASSYGNELCTYLKSVRVIDNNGNLQDLNKAELFLKWRGSIFKENKFLIIYAKFFISKKMYIGEELTKKKSLKISEQRKIYQENDLPNIGSIFATKNIYKDLSKKNFTFLVVYFIYKILSAYYFNFNTKKLEIFRKKSVKIYLKLLKLDKYENFSSSSKTLNCLVNKGSNSSTEAINFLKQFKKESKNCLNFENIILHEID